MIKQIEAIMDEIQDWEEQDIKELAMEIYKFLMEIEEDAKRTG